MKLLFISTSDVNSKRNGGELCTNRNYLSMCELYGAHNVTVINLMEIIPSGIINAIKKRVNFIKGYYEGLDAKTLKKIKSQVNKYDIVFINSSTHGSLAKALKKASYKGTVVSFFHNVEYDIKKERLKNEPWKLLEVNAVKQNERNACRYSDTLIALNKRDEAGLIKRYKASGIHLVPISLPDNFYNVDTGTTKTPPSFLFTGNNWYANIHGIRWFIDNVLDHVNIKLQITGHKMDALKSTFAHPKIEYLGFVDDLGAVLNEADYILIPIFYGSGMKVKTCEALMHGKHIIGTTEAFEGYELDYSKVGALCNTKHEFISAINKLTARELDKFNAHSRNYYLQKYSFKATLEQFKSLLPK